MFGLFFYSFFLIIIILAVATSDRYTSILNLCRDTSQCSETISAFSDVASLYCKNKSHIQLNDCEGEYYMTQYQRRTLNFAFQDVSKLIAC